MRGSHKFCLCAWCEGVSGVRVDVSGVRVDVSGVTHQ